METFFEDQPSTSQPNREASRGAEDLDHEPTGWTSSAGTVTETQEQHMSSGIDDISKRLQKWVEKINDSRTIDQNVIDGFQEKLVEKVSDMCQQMKQHMYTVCEANSSNMQQKLQELSEVLESCTKLSQDLMEASQALASLRDGLSSGPDL